jgi:hypothetical protein
VIVRASRVVPSSTNERGRGLFRRENAHVLAGAPSAVRRVQWGLGVRAISWREANGDPRLLKRRGVQIAPQLAAVIGGITAAGALLGFLMPPTARKRRTGERTIRAAFFSSAFGYLAVSLLDFWEHMRLEKEMTGRYFATQAVPLGETVNHGATIATLLGILILARPLPERLAPRDHFVLAAPILFLVLGWRDELVYHRKRSTHREDMMHTVAHLGAGVMLGAHYGNRLTAWHRR